jgi:hypothetical protein
MPRRYGSGSLRSRRSQFSRPAVCHEPPPLTPSSPPPPPPLPPSFFVFYYGVVTSSSPPFGDHEIAGIALMSTEGPPDTYVSQPGGLPLGPIYPPCYITITLYPNSATLDAFLWLGRLGLWRGPAYTTAHVYSPNPFAFLIDTPGWVDEDSIHDAILRSWP